jgi:hypothetical protein
MGDRVMKSRAKSAESARSVERASKSIRPPAMPRKSVPAKAGKSIPPLASKSASAKARKSSQPAGGSKKAAESAGKRRLGMRGAAPWAARHAAKHAEEAAARNLEPPKPGSARGTLRTPDDADTIKQRISELHNVLGRIRAMRKNLNSEFYRIGGELKQVQERKLYEAKGFSSFEAFAERELDLGKATTLKLARVPDLFTEAGAREYGVEAILAAIDLLDERASATPQRKATPGRAHLPLKPPR